MQELYYKLQYTNAFIMPFDKFYHSIEKIGFSPSKGDPEFNISYGTALTI